jgi:E3 ubiquitin-protein ligase UBR4
VFDTSGTMYKRERSTKVAVNRSDLGLISTVSVSFPISGIVGNPAAKEHVAVFGKKSCAVLIFDPKGRSASRVHVELALDSTQGASSSQPLTVIKVEWIPQSQVLLAVTTNKFVKVFDLSKDTISPLHYFSPTRATQLKDSTFGVHGSDQIVTLFALALDGRILTSRVSENFPVLIHHSCVLCHLIYSFHFPSQ